MLLRTDKLILQENPQCSQQIPLKTSFRTTAWLSQDAKPFSQPYFQESSKSRPHTRNFFMVPVCTRSRILQIHTLFPKSLKFFNCSLPLRLSGQEISGRLRSKRGPMSNNISTPRGGKKRSPEKTSVVARDPYEAH